MGIYNLIHSDAQSQTHNGIYLNTTVNIATFFPVSSLTEKICKMTAVQSNSGDCVGLGPTTKDDRNNRPKLPR